MDQDDPWSVTDRDLYDELRSMREANTNAALATVVDVAGSAYRRPGAKLVVPVGTDALGAITAGCLKGPVANLAAEARDTGAIMLETFDLMDDDWGLGLGCNGVIDVLVEPLDDSVDPVLAAIDDGDATTALTVVESDDETVPVGARTVVSDTGVKSGDDRAEIPETLLEEVRNTAKTARESGTSTLVTVGREAGDVRIFVDGIKPAPNLVLFGAQNDINVISQLGVQAGFRVTVGSPRGGRADPDQFPDAHRVHAIHPTDIPSLIEDAERTYVVLLSHNLVDDRLALETLLAETDVPYIGLMGPRKRFRDLREAAKENGRMFTAEELDRVSTPVGLDLGDGSPIGIAMSIVSEVLAAANDADGGPLSETPGPIHPRSKL